MKLAKSSLFNLISGEGITTVPPTLRGRKTSIIEGSNPRGATAAIRR
jgi:hypothetical protein